MAKYSDTIINVKDPATARVITQKIAGPKGNDGQLGPMLGLTVQNEPENPEVNNCIIWLSTNGDINIKVNIAGTIKTGVLFDFSEE